MQVDGLLILCGNISGESWIGNGGKRSFCNEFNALECYGVDKRCDKNGARYLLNDAGS